MKIKSVLLVLVLIAVFPVFIFSGCKASEGKAVPPIETAAVTVSPSDTIGSLTEVFALDYVVVEGYGLVGGLNGTGSPQCPPEIRSYLEKYIRKQLSPGMLNVDKLINSNDTAVVVIRGMLPAAVTKPVYFDVEVFALPETQTTSLEGGWLYQAELKEVGKFWATSRVLGIAKGPIFINTLGDVNNPVRTRGFILAGGTVLDEYKITLGLRTPNFKMAGLIRDRLNGAFNDSANALSASLVDVSVPPKYIKQKNKFIDVLKAMYLNPNPALNQDRIKPLIQNLKTSSEKYHSEAVLEAIGKDSIPELILLLTSQDQQLLLSAGRCLLNLDSDKGLLTLHNLVSDQNSKYRIEALHAIALGANKRTASSISRRLLGDKDIDVRLAAYEILRELDDISIDKKFIGRNFFLEEVGIAKEKLIYVSRSGYPRIVLFGPPITCKQDIFIQSEDGKITINSLPGQKGVSIIRKNPKDPLAFIEVKSSGDLREIIEKLGEEPTVKKGEEAKPGLNVSYDEIIAIIKKMCDKGAVEVEFRAGPVPKSFGIIK